jgi:hypothetical protein
MNVEGILAAIIPIVTALEQLGIAYYIGGSVVSSIYGIPRATFDVDLIADLRPEHIRPFVKHLETDYYIDEDMIRDAIVHHSSFNVMYLASMLKVDVFLATLIRPGRIPQGTTRNVDPGNTSILRCLTRRYHSP